MYVGAVQAYALARRSPRTLAVLRGDSADSKFGASVAIVPNGLHSDDLVVGSPGRSEVLTYYGGTDAGLPSGPRVVPSGVAQAGQTVAATPINGASATIVVGAPASGANGALWLATWATTGTTMGRLDAPGSPIIMADGGVRSLGAAIAQ
jgi:hypothetical protein